jgi:hypothetical protein
MHPLMTVLGNDGLVDHFQRLLVQGAYHAGSKPVPRRSARERAARPMVAQPLRPLGPYAGHGVPSASRNYVRSKTLLRRVRLLRYVHLGPATARCSPRAGPSRCTLSRGPARICLWPRHARRP